MVESVKTFFMRRRITQATAHSTITVSHDTAEAFRLNMLDGAVWAVGTMSFVLLIAECIS